MPARKTKARVLYRTNVMSSTKTPTKTCSKQSWANMIRHDCRQTNDAFSFLGSICVKQLTRSFRALHTTIPAACTGGGGNRPSAGKNSKSDVIRPKSWHRANPDQPHKTRTTNKQKTNQQQNKHSKLNNKQQDRNNHART